MRSYESGILIVRVGAMGDVLHALPAVTALHRLQPALPISWIIDPRWASLLVPDADSSGPVVSRVHLAETKLWSRAPWAKATRHSVLALRRDLRQARYAAAIDMQGTLRSAVLGRFAATGQQAGYADPREYPARWLYQQVLPRTGRHVVEQGASLLGAALGLTLAPARDVPLPRIPETEAWADNILASLAPARPFALLAPTAGWGAKQWPAERFGVLASALRREGLAVLVNAAHPDDPIAAAVVAASHGAAITITGGIAGLVALTRRASLVVGGDSGPVHLAAALGTPLVALFGPTDPERNGPWGPGPLRVLRHPDSRTTYKRTSAPDPGLAKLEVATVLRAALEVLPRPASSRPEAPGPERP